MPQRDHVDDVDSKQNGTVEPITAREREVAELIAEGLSNEQIAHRLVVTPGTVANHVAHILSKLGLQSRVQVAVKVASDKSRVDAESILALLKALQQVDGATARDTMQHATDVLAAVFVADKVDAFFYDEAAEQLVALGTSQTPLGQLQHELGLNRLPLADGGRATWVFREKRPFRSGHVEDDTVELAAVRCGLEVRSTIAAPIQVGPGQPGVLLAASRQPDHFTEDQLDLLQFVAYWIGLVARDQAAAAWASSSHSNGSSDG
jgi:DNA-binding CsgD family transcriptional regulator